MRPRFVPIALATIGMVVALAFTALPAGAQVEGGCTASIAGKDAAKAHNVPNAVTVKDDSIIVVTGTAPGPITGYEIFLAFGPFKFKVADGEVADGDTTFTDEVDVGDYSKYGAGIYRVEGETLGTTCTGWAYVKVEGPFPILTVAGAVGTLLTLGGLVGMFTSLRGRS